jgi:hypothetical protein
MDHDQRIELEEIEKSNRIDYNIDREEIEMELDDNETPVTVTDIPSPDGLEDSPEGLIELQNALAALFGGPRRSEEDERKHTALMLLMPIIDAGVDSMAMEGAMKNPGEMRTLEGQLQTRGELVDGILEALKVFGVEPNNVFEAMDEVSRSGYRFRQNEEDITDRLTVWDELTVINMLYGPRLAGIILAAREAENASED